MNHPATQSPAPRECCTELNCESGLRNNYFEGKRLSVDSFRVEQKYSLDRRRLLNRAIHGWGVVYGYEISIGASATEMGRRRLKIGAGLALDRCGRELVQTDTPIDVADLLVLTGKGAKRVNLEKLATSALPSLVSVDSPRTCWLLSVHYAEQYVAPVTVEDSCRCKYHEWDHTCETVRYSLRRIRRDECCQDFECELHCRCGTGKCCEESDNDEDREKPRPQKRGGCRCLCDHLTQLVPGAECCPLCEVEDPCAQVWVDLHNGVPLACVELVRDECDRWAFSEVEACGPRRLVKRNDLLFDLIRGCDLTRIGDFGWKDWVRRNEPISFDEFSNGLGPDEGYRLPEYVSDVFWITFTGPVRVDSLLPDCFAITVMLREREGGWWQMLRLPILRIDTAGFPWDRRDPPGTVRGARVVLEGGCVEDGVRGRWSHFLGSETQVEVEVRGDLIIDCNGQTIDANAVGRARVPTGNGTPGGTFLSTFRIAPGNASLARSRYDSGDRQRGVSS